MKKYVVLAFVVISVFVASCISVPKISVPEGIIVSPGVSVNVGQGKILEVYFVDVGQGDCTIYRYDKTNALIIDAGSGSQSDKVVNFINSLGIKRFDVVIATHPDEDHIGSLDDVINTFGANKVYAPKITKNTVAFENFANAVKNQDIKITVPISGDVFNLGEVSFRILAPNSESYDSTNNYSIVTRAVYGDNSFLNMGDAENISENEIISRGYDLNSHVIKIGHHGSKTSTSEIFFNKVNPHYSIVSVGRNNKYDHPDQEIMERISLASIVYRTDLTGTISFVSENGERASEFWEGDDWMNRVD